MTLPGRLHINPGLAGLVDDKVDLSKQVAAQAVARENLSAAIAALAVAAKLAAAPARRTGSAAITDLEPRWRAVLAAAETADLADLDLATAGGEDA